jgi:transcriptional regulator with XRE-family HTH domain
MVLVRHLLGGVLRRQRLRQGLTLREVSIDARVSLGYISEVERGQKEASSELLAAICAALEVPLSDVLREVSDEIDKIETPLVPATVPSSTITKVAPKRIEAPQMDGKLIEGKRIEGKRIETSQIEGPRIDKSRIEAAHVDKARIESGQIDDGPVEAANSHRAVVVAA